MLGRHRLLKVVAKGEMMARPIGGSCLTCKSCRWIDCLELQKSDGGIIDLV
jgi:hypothetical protein